MTRKDRKRYSKEFKLEAVRRSYDSGKPITEVARELDISVHHLYRWRDQIHRDGMDVWPGHQGQKAAKPEQNELAALRRENKQLKEERDILKKTLVFFAVDQVRGTDSSKTSEDNTK
jgi:transposase